MTASSIWLFWLLTIYNTNNLTTTTTTVDIELAKRSYIGGNKKIAKEIAKWADSAMEQMHGPAPALEDQ